MTQAKSRPFIAITSFFSLGIILERFFNIPFFILYGLSGLFLILAVLFLNHKKRSTFLLLCAIFFLGATLLKNSTVLPASHIAHFTPFKGESIYLEGVIDSFPLYRKETKFDNASFIFRAEKLKSAGTEHEVCGKVLVKVFSREDFFYGERLFLEGKLYRPPAFLLSERLNYRDYLKNKGIYSILAVARDKPVLRLAKSQGNPLKSFTFSSVINLTSIP